MYKEKSTLKIPYRTQLEREILREASHSIDNYEGFKNRQKATFKCWIYKPVEMKIEELCIVY